MQRARVARMTPTVNSSDFVILSFLFFFFGFQPKATRAGDEKHRKIHMALLKSSNKKMKLAINRSRSGNQLFLHCSFLEAYCKPGREAGFLGAAISFRKLGLQYTGRLATNISSLCSPNRCSLAYHLIVRDVAESSVIEKACVRVPNQIIVNYLNKG